MALKAGYYGVKKKILDELRKLDGILPAGVSKDNKLATQSEIDDVWEGLTITGVHNLWNNTASSGDVNECSFTVEDNKSVTVNGTPSDDAYFNLFFNASTDRLTIPGAYKVKGGPNSTPNCYVFARVTHADSTRSYYGDNDGNGAEFTLAENEYVQLLAYAKKNAVIDNVQLFPMIVLSSDTDNEYAPYAMTNKELTASASDQKTAINAIIAAATDAADFAAFKTAMGAITPGTRSLSIQEPETRSLDPEPEPETKTTKRSTKKTETTE